MLIATTCSEVRAQVAAWKKEGLTVGLVPTMGYLHEGHASLVEEAVRQCDRVVVSDFVNPTQFGPNEDLEAYPRDFRRDCAILEAHGCHLVFHPTVEEMYPPGRGRPRWKCYLRCPNSCAARPAPSISGACAPWWPSYSILSPRTKAFFGQKDAQQLAILRRMVRDLSYGITLVGCPIVREPDGLAKSSRNTYLSKEERRPHWCFPRLWPMGRSLVASGGDRCPQHCDGDDRPHCRRAPGQSGLCLRCGWGDHGAGGSNSGRGSGGAGGLYWKNPSH